MRKLAVRFTRDPGESRAVGTLAEDQGRVFFEYDPLFLATGLNLSPFRLPFAPGLFEHQHREFGPLPGLFDDSLPDGWGLLLMDRHFAKGGLPPAGIHPLDRLAFLGTRTMGALTYHPPADSSGPRGGAVDLHELAGQAQSLLAGDAKVVLPQLLELGGSPGGARPKVLVGVRRQQVIAGTDELPAGFEPWIIKFAAREEARDAGPIEYAYALMAAAAGLTMPPTRLFATGQGGRYFGVRRFDRAGSRRFHVHTFGNLLEANFRIPSCDYRLLLKATAALTGNQADVLEAYRRMVFNVVTHNRDDHVKNFAFLLDDATSQWHLAPAYDLAFASGPGGQHTMTVDGEGVLPGREHCLHLAAEFGISRRAALAVVGQVNAAGDRWPKLAARAHVSRAGAARVQSALRHL